jgi:hypothetical protein
MKLCKTLFALFILFTLAEGISRTQSTPGSTPASTAAAQAPPAASVPQHSCIDEERAALQHGEGFGMAAPADRGGYPGPRHVLALAAELKLSPDQVAALQKLQADMTEKSIARGKEIFAAEERLEEMFRGGRPEADLREQSFRIDSLHAELRWVHLSVHLAARAVFNPGQVAAYQRMRSDSGHAGSAP